MVKHLSKRQLCVALCIAALGLILLRLVRSVFTRHPASPVGERRERQEPAIFPLQRPVESVQQSTALREPEERVAPVSKPVARPPQRRSGLRVEKILLAVEIGAVLLFAVAGIALWQTRRELNDTYRNLQQPDPRLLPTLVAAANPGVLPQSLAQAGEVSGPPSKPPLPTPYPTATRALAAQALAPTPISSQQVKTNTEQQPAEKSMSPQQYGDIEWGTTVVMQKRVADHDQPRRLNIPAIEVDSFIFQDYGEDWLKLGVVQVGAAVEPGKPGNLVLAAHNDIYGEIFRDLDQLQAGDEVMVSGESLVYSYRVREILIVEPDDIWVTLPTSTPTLTLVSCYPYLLGNQRIVVFADLIQ